MLEVYGLNIAELKSGMKRISVEATVVEKGTPRQVMSRFGTETYTVADAIVADESGKIKLTLWNEQIAQVKVNDKIKIEIYGVEFWATPGVAIADRICTTARA